MLLNTLLEIYDEGLFSHIALPKNEKFAFSNGEIVDYRSGNIILAGIKLDNDSGKYVERICNELTKINCCGFYLVN